MAKFQDYSKPGCQAGETDRVATFVQFGWFMRYRCYRLLLLAATLLLPGIAEAHHAPGALTATAEKTSCPGASCVETTASFTIIGTSKLVHWTAMYYNPFDKGSFYLTTTPGSSSADILLGGVGVTSGDAWLDDVSPGKTGTTYYISIRNAVMKNGKYTVQYNPGSTGDPHITTINGARYDFQAAGEFIFLRQPKDLEIQVRHTPVSTQGVTCVSINTAIAAKLGSHRVTYQPNLNGESDPSGLQLRVDGTLTDLKGGDIDFGNHSRITRTSAPGGLRIDFPDGSSLFITPGWWADQGKWYLNLNIAPASDGGLGIAGAIGKDTWLPALPDGSSMGPMPRDPHDQYVDLNQKFADAWRVTDENSLFDYASGTSTGTFTNKSWPSEQAPCSVPGTTPAAPIAENLAKALCQGVWGAEYENCVYDVMTTGNPGFAATYALSQSVLADALNKEIPPVCDPDSSWLKWLLIGLLIGLFIALLIFLLWRKKTQP